MSSNSRHQSSEAEMSSQDNNSKNAEYSSKSSEDMQPPITPVVTRPQSPRINRTNQTSFIQDVTLPVPSNQIQECIMRREKRGPFGSYVYQFFGQDSDPIFTAKKKSSLLHTNFLIYEPISGKIVGNVNSDSKCLNYTITGPDDFKFTVTYDENFLGRHGCRSFVVVFPENKKFISKPPITIAGNYYQDFHDLDTVQSIKNFVCVDKSDYKKEVCIFVRSTTEDVFTLRIAEPFTLFAGFALALTSLHTGIFHR